MTISPSKWTVPLFMDMHQHLRENDELLYTTAWAGQWCDTIVAMPNTRDPLTKAGKIQLYRKQIEEHYKRPGNIIIPLYLTQDTTPDDIQSDHEAGVIAAKAYPRGKTSHSGFGIRDFRAMTPTFLAMARCGMRLLIHPEHPDYDAWQGEEAFFSDIWPSIRTLVKKNGLYVSLEHLSTRIGVQAVEKDRTGRVVGTVTPHHMLAHVGHIGDRWDSAYMCKPMLKDPADQIYLRQAVTSGRDDLLLGSDSAPWCIADKHRYRPCSGCWTAPWLPQLVATVFDEEGGFDDLIHNFIRFTHDNAVTWWGLEPTQEQIYLRRGKTPISEVDRGYHRGYVPFLGGSELGWEATRILEMHNEG